MLDRKRVLHQSTGQCMGAQNTMQTTFLPITSPDIKQLFSS